MQCAASRGFPADRESRPACRPGSNASDRRFSARCRRGTDIAHRATQARAGLHKQTNRPGAGHQCAPGCEDVLHAVVNPAQPAMVHFVHGPDRAIAAVDDAAADMVLQILTDAGQIVHHRCSERLQQRSRANARQLQNLRRVDGAATQNHLPAGPHLMPCTVLQVLDGDRALAFHRNTGVSSHGFRHVDSAAASPDADSRPPRSTGAVRAPSIARGRRLPARRR